MWNSLVWWRKAGITLGPIFIVVALVVSFFDPVPASFFYITGAALVGVSMMDLATLKSFEVSPTGFKGEFERIAAKVDEADTILRRVEEIETRLLITISEQMINRGGEHYMGGTGEEAEFNIFEAANSGQASDHPRVVANMALWKRRLLQTLIYAALGSRGERKPHPATIQWLIQRDFKEMPTAKELTTLLREDGVLESCPADLLTSYAAFRDQDIPPGAEVLQQIYSLRRRD